MAEIDAALAAARDRFRPILMTAFSFIPGAIPSLIASGAGAEARRFPTLSLTANARVASTELSELTDSDAAICSIGANLFAPLFDAGRNKRRVGIKVACAEQLLTQYELTVLQAFREVEVALIAVRTLRAEISARDARSLSRSLTCTRCWEAVGWSMASRLRKNSPHSSNRS